MPARLSRFHNPEPIKNCILAFQGPMDSSVQYSDKELLRRIADGEEQAFTTLFWRYKDMIYSTGLRLTGSVTEAEEIVQDVFVKLWTKRQDMPDIANLEGYIFMMARNYTYNSLQRTIKLSSGGGVIPEERDPAEVTADALLEEKELNELLHQAIQQLPPQQQKVYQLIKLEGLTKQEAAEKLGISVHTVKSHFDAAVRAIRAFIAARIELILLILWLS